MNIYIYFTNREMNDNKNILINSLEDTIQNKNGTYDDILNNKSDDILNKRDKETSTIMDFNSNKSKEQSCVIYRFHSRPPYEGFILILVTIIIIILFIWFLNNKNI